MFNAYIKAIMPVPIANIEVSEENPYMYRVTVYSSLVDENTDRINKRLLKNKRIANFSGWFFKRYDFTFKQAYIEFKKTPSK